MKKRLLAFLVLSIFIYADKAYAIYDIMAKVESGLELGKDLETKAKETMKKITDAEKRARQGFDGLSSCFKNPKKCDYKAMEQLGKEGSGYVKKIKEVRVMPGAEEMKEGDLKKKASEGLMGIVRQTYIYQRAQKESLKMLNENRRQINALIADDLALLFAKGVSTRQSILAEDGSLYQTDFNNDNIDEILKAQNVVGIASANRINRILELRTYMVGAAATAELTNQNREEVDEEE